MWARVKKRRKRKGTKLLFLHYMESRIKILINGQASHKIVLCSIVDNSITDETVQRSWYDHPFLSSSINGKF